MSRAARHRRGTGEVIGQGSPHGRRPLTRRRSKPEAVSGPVTVLEAATPTRAPRKPAAAKSDPRPKRTEEAPYKAAQRRRREESDAERTVMLSNGQRVPYTAWAAGQKKGESLKRRTWAWIRERVAS